MAHRGSCHCGKVAFELDGEVAEVIDCNCSMCRRRGGLLAFFPAEAFTLLTPESDYGTYRFNAERIAHHRHANEIVTAAAAGFPNVEVVAVAPLLRSRADFTNSIRHYSRRVYHDLAGIIGDRLALDVVAEPAVAAKPSKAPAVAAKPPAPTWRRALRKVKRAASSALGD